MATWVGTSGYNYPEWKGSFYPQKLPTAKMLPYYAERFSTVEINYTFSRMPSSNCLSPEAAHGEDVSLLFRALFHRRDQLHLLSYAQREDPRRVESRDAGWIQADLEGAQAHHTRRPAARLCGAVGPFSPPSQYARRKARRDPVPTSAVFQKRPEGVGCVPGGTTGG